LTNSANQVSLPSPLFLRIPGVVPDQDLTEGWLVRLQGVLHPIKADPELATAALLKGQREHPSLFSCPRCDVGTHLEVNKNTRRSGILYRKKSAGEAVGDESFHLRRSIGMTGFLKNGPQGLSMVEG
jgi:hypothetical protein